MLTGCFRTTEYHKTQNILQVQRLLGHKSILNTQIYVNLEQPFFEANDIYDVKVASTIEEVCTKKKRSWFCADGAFYGLGFGCSANAIGKP